MTGMHVSRDRCWQYPYGCRRKPLSMALGTRAGESARSGQPSVRLGPALQVAGGRDDIDLRNVNSVCIASVVPAATVALTEYRPRLAEVEPMIVHRPAVEHLARHG